MRLHDEDDEKNTEDSIPYSPENIASSSSPQESALTLKGLSARYKRLIFIILIVVFISLFLVDFNQKQRNTEEALLQRSYPLPVRNPSTIDWRYGKNYDITQLCKGQTWRKNIYLDCSNLRGGLFNVHSEIMGCFRRAIDAGLGIILPTITPRSSTDLKGFKNEDYDTSYLYDVESIQQNFRRACPDFQIRDQKVNIDIKIKSPDMALWHFSTGFYRHHIDSLLALNGINPDGDSSIVVIYQWNSFVGWNWAEEGLKVHMDFYKYFPFNRNAVRLVDPIINKLPEHFLALHLRVEEDYQAFNPEDLRKWFAALARKLLPQIKTVYIATGQKSVEDAFIADSRFKNYKVITKWSLAEGNATQTEEMKKLSFDQIAVIDYEVMLRATHFYGVTHSSFSYAIAVLRGYGNMANCSCDLFEIVDPYFVGAY